MFEDYIKQIGLENLTPHIQEVEFYNFVRKAFCTAPLACTDEETKNLYEYVVPKISPDGSCSIIDTPDEKPYNLATTFRLTPDWHALATHPQTIRLWRLKQIVTDVVAITKVNWFGIYRKVQNTKNEWVLVKESYAGLFSRPEFPLTEEFAKKSNNSTVGLTGVAKVIQDVAANQGPYYKCDGNVQSEFCLPILDSKNSVIGIIDAEAFDKNFFTNEKLLQIAKVAFDLGKIHLGYTHMENGRDVTNNMMPMMQTG